MGQSLSLQYLSLSHLQAISNSQFIQLLKHFNSLSAILSADGAELRKLGLSDYQIRAISKLTGNKSESPQVEKELKWLEEKSHHLICFEEDHYPPLLKQISHPPPFLYLKGSLASLSIPQIAIVGSRNASCNGKQNAFWIAKELSRCGFSICSGIAQGIDTQAHLGALAARGITIAVLGTGLNRTYPSTNRMLAEEVAEQGALVTEFPLDSPPLAAHFPQRNRIISGLCVGVIVVEATLKSGSLITARFALEQNREVFAIPGSIRNPSSRGCHKLIREGAKLVDSPEAILEEIAALVSFQINVAKEEAIEKHTTITTPQEDKTLSVAELKVLDVLACEDCHLDTLLRESAMDIQATNAAIINLEIKGLIERQAGRIRRIT